jgi:hypothetical protein
MLKIKKFMFGFSGDSVDGEKLWLYHKNLIAQLWAKNQVFVTNLSFDFGSSNQAMCRSLGILASRTNINVAIPHPGDETRKLVLMTDAPHGLKGLKKMVLSYVLKLPEW